MIEQTSPSLGMRIGKIIAIILFCVAPFTGLFIFVISIMMTDAPSTAKAMGIFLMIYWGIAISLYLASLVISIVMWSDRRRSVVPLVLSVVSFVVVGTPFVLLPLGGLVLSIIK